MPTYVVLYRFTDKGRRSIKSTVRRAAQVRRENERRGFKVVGTWWTQGHYDLVSVIDAPSEPAMLSGLFSIAEAGNVTSETLRAHTDSEMARALAGGTVARKPARRTARPAARKTATRRTAARPAARRTARRTAARPAARRTTAARKPARRATRRR